MKNLKSPFLGAAALFSVGLTAFSHAESSDQFVPLEPSYFIKENLTGKIEQRMEKLGDGTEALCWVIPIKARPTEHAMGPWCPKLGSDDDSKGGVWLKDGKVHQVDGSFISNLGKLYDDPKWNLLREDGSVKVTETREAFNAAARPDVDPNYQNYCVEFPAGLEIDHSTTYFIPVHPVIKEKSTGEGRPERRGPGGPGGGAKGVAFNGVNFDPPAPLHAIIAAHTIAPLDDSGGHVNPHTGYHYHAAMGATKEIVQKDGHAPMIGYVLDGFALFAHLDQDGKAPEDLDEFGGHRDDVRGYHYHAGSPGSNQVVGGYRGNPGRMVKAIEEGNDVSEAEPSSDHSHPHPHPHEEEK